MLKRTVTAVVAASLLAVVCIFSDTPVFPIAIGLCAFIGTYEMLGCVGARRIFSIAVSFYALCIISTVMTLTVSGHAVFVAAYASLIFCILILLLGVSIFSRGAVPFEKVCIAFTSCAYIITGFMCLVLLRRMPRGEYFYLLAFIGPWVTDTFAYFTGMLFGRHKLLPEVSPKKTVEGSVGGIVFCTAASGVYGYVIRCVMQAEGMPPVYVFLVLGFVVSVVSQVGDLILSLIKRKYGIKDYGFIFPGHGGVLDRFDSIIAAAPLILMFFEAMNKTGIFG